MLSYQTISRGDLQSPAPSTRSSPDPILSAQLRSRFLNDITYSLGTDAEHDSAEIEQALRDENSEAELVLFAAPASSAPQTHRIRLQSPEAHTASGFIVQRPRSYYFADDMDTNTKSQFELSAIHAETIRALAKEPWLGCALPWKVKRISPAGMKGCVLEPHPDLCGAPEGHRNKGRRKGKKSRVAMRIRLRMRAATQAEEERLKKEKDEAEREKKTRRNREKKMKKKARNKAKKSVENDGATAHAGGVQDNPYMEPEIPLITTDNVKL